MEVLCCAHEKVVTSGGNNNTSPTKPVLFLLAQMQMEDLV